MAASRPPSEAAVVPFGRSATRVILAPYIHPGPDLRAILDNLPGNFLDDV
jgi:hypothetical protein